MTPKYVALIFAFALVAPGSAMAVPAYELIVGKPPGLATTTAPTDVNSGDVFFGTVTVGRSYCCEVLNSFPPNGLAYIGTITGSSNVTFNAIPRGLTDPALSSSPIANADRTRLCFIPTSTVQKSSAFFFPVQSDSVSVIEQVKPSCVQTSLYGRYNTSVNEFNFLSISNLIGQDSDTSITGLISGTVTLTNSVTGGAAKVLYFSVPQGARVDVDIHSAVGNGAFGTIILDHNGPEGTVKAVVDQYRVLSVSPLNFALVGQEKLEAR